MLTSPVNAPFCSGLPYCAPTMRNFSRHARMSTYVGNTTTSMSGRLRYGDASPSHPCGGECIFQFAAMRGLRSLMSQEYTSHAAGEAVSQVLRHAVLPGYDASHAASARRPRIRPCRVSSEGGDQGPS